MGSQGRRYLRYIPSGTRGIARGTAVEAVQNGFAEERTFLLRFGVVCFAALRGPSLVTALFEAEFG